MLAPLTSGFVTGRFVLAAREAHRPDPEVAAERGHG